MAVKYKVSLDILTFSKKHSCHLADLINTFSGVFHCCLSVWYCPSITTVIPFNTHVSQKCDITLLHSIKGGMTAQWEINCFICWSIYAEGTQPILLGVLVCNTCDKIRHYSTCWHIANISHSQQQALLLCSYLPLKCYACWFNFIAGSQDYTSI